LRFVRIGAMVHRTRSFASKEGTMSTIRRAGGALFCLLAACGDDASTTDAGTTSPGSDGGADCGAPESMPGADFYACGATWCATGAEYCCNASAVGAICGGFECRDWAMPFAGCMGTPGDCSPGGTPCGAGEFCCDDGDSLRCAADCTDDIRCLDAATDCPAALGFCCMTAPGGPRVCRDTACP
jgi:hypothetical protein